MSKHLFAAVVFAFGSVAGISALILPARTEGRTQTTVAGKIGGHVRGQRGEGVQRAAVVIFSRDGGIQRTTRTNTEGSFQFSGLPAGSYTIQGCAEGFAPSTAATLELTGGSDLTEDLRVGNPVENRAETSCDIDVADPVPPKTRYYDGSLMSLDMNADVREVLRSIASIGQLGIDMPPSISGMVSVHLKNIPWDFALDVVLRTSGLASKTEGKTLRVQIADPALGQDRVLMGTVTLAGRIASFSLQSPRSLVELKAPDSGGTAKTWPLEWESGEYLREHGIAPNTLKAGDQVIVTGSITRTNTLRLVSIRRSDNFAWGYLSDVRPSSFDGAMFVSLSQR